jgi:lysophospholipase L1-like esterase
VLAYLPEYIEVVHRLAGEFDTLNVRTQDLFAEQLNFRTPDYFCPEPVHPFTSGHVVIAHGLLQVWEW